MQRENRKTRISPPEKLTDSIARLKGAIESAGKNMSQDQMREFFKHPVFSEYTIERLAEIDLGTHESDDSLAEDFGLVLAIIHRLKNFEKIDEKEFETLRHKFLINVGSYLNEVEKLKSL